MAMNDLANHIIARAQNTKLGITNLQLQKVLYFTLIDGLKQEIIDESWLSKQYDSNFFVWRYGPVVKTIYEKYSVYGGAKIFEPKEEIAEFSKLNTVIDFQLKQKVSELTSKSLQHDFWKENMFYIVRGRSNIPYQLENLINETKKVLPLKREVSL
ncbi:TPA: hypothetical protein KER80_000025 [Enterococcus faecalis]|uniref:hypothetical protein n=1 Tax=Enterococcus faecalis TaxID=1351 RepID=UPI001B8DB35E|nr:hypothetical protein [Enterococcus faecalis]MDN3137277.1 hypothetical protein [Enterococcus faecalis]HBC4462986.1 hypothetical protein [Enterococcus faecalis]